MSSEISLPKTVDNWYFIVFQFEYENWREGRTGTCSIELDDSILVGEQVEPWIK